MEFSISLAVWRPAIPHHLTITDLPEDVLNSIFLMLNISDLKIVACVCKSFCAAVYNENLWRIKTQERIAKLERFEESCVLTDLTWKEKFKQSCLLPYVVFNSGKFSNFERAIDWFVTK